MHRGESDHEPELRHRKGMLTRFRVIMPQEVRELGVFVAHPGSAYKPVFMRGM